MSTADRSTELFRVMLTEQRADWCAGRKHAVEYYIQQRPELRENVNGLLDLIYSEYCLREEHGQEVDIEDYAHRFPDYFVRLKPLFALHKAIASSSADGDITSEAQGSDVCLASDAATETIKG